ncbi:hypothetical protein [Cellulomonas sp. NTE-D12]|uniref:hypothetical protein n=1 Tax=Cellulomonas sp. NTE-D12 TaxID=2962632 RepID=UPI0030813918|nr:hypothetical protein CELD12_08940 [Cellulomonas sp. NTE-D12]
MAYEFDLVAADGTLRFADDAFNRAAFLLPEFQPATQVTLIGTPPSRIRVRAQGSPTEVAPGLLERIEALAGTSLRRATAE